MGSELLDVLLQVAMSPENAPAPPAPPAAVKAVPARFTGGSSAPSDGRSSTKQNTFVPSDGRIPSNTLDASSMWRQDAAPASDNGNGTAAAASRAACWPGFSAEQAADAAASDSSLPRLSTSRAPSSEPSAAGDAMQGAAEQLTKTAAASAAAASDALHDLSVKAGADARQAVNVAATAVKAAAEDAAEKTAQQLSQGAAVIRRTTAEAAAEAEQAAAEAAHKQVC